MIDQRSGLRDLMSSAAKVGILGGLSVWASSAQGQTAQVGFAQSQPAPVAMERNQQLPAPAPSASSADIGEIIVTAQKRQTFLQDTPIAMNAFRSDDIRRADVTDVSGLTRLAPDLQMSQVNSFVQLSIRGVTSLDTSATGDPALTVNIDGEYINRGIAIGAALFDLERVEILRGPQGTLYGRNATGGAINLIDAKPQFTNVNGFVTAGYGNYNAKHAEAAINLPVSDNLAFRIAAFHNDHDGYRDNAPARRGDDADTTAVRASALFKPTDRLTAYIAGEFVDVDQAGVAQYGVLVDSSTPGLVPYTNPSDPTQSSFIPSQSTFRENPSRFALDTVGFFKSRQYAVRGRLDYNLGPATLSYIGSYRDINSSQFNNSDGLAPNGGTHYDVYTPKQNSGTQNHELRLSSAPSSPIVWQTGVFYFKEAQNLVQGVFSPNFTAGGFFPAAPAVVFTDFRPDFKSTSKAVFGQTTIPIVENVVSVTGGIRYTKDKKTSTYIQCPLNLPLYLSGTDGSAPDSATCPGRTSTAQKASGSKLTWTAGIDWHPAPNHLIFGKVSTGYKSGGFDTVGSFGPETLTAYEIGSKNQFFDRKLTFNVSAFYYDYSNQQVQVLLDLNGGFRTENAGKSRIYGIETDTNLQLSSDDRMGLTANYLNAKYTEYAGQYATLSGAVYPANLAGHKPPLSPKFVVAGNYDHVFHIGELGTLTASAVAHYTSSYYLSVTNFAGTRVGAFEKTDLSLEYATPSKTFTVRAYVHNIENKVVHTYAAYIAQPSEYVFEYSEPRTFGIQATKQF
jgi:iron complex outermembrane receptor protein